MSKGEGGTLKDKSLVTAGATVSLALTWRGRDGPEDEDDAVVPVLFETLPEKAGHFVLVIQHNLTDIP